MLNRRFLPLLVIFALAWSVRGQSECSGSADPKAVKLYEKARKESRSGDGNKAYALYEDAIAIDPEYPDPYYRLGLICRTRGKRDYLNQDALWNKSVTYLRRVIELCPDFDHYVYYYLGEIEFILEDYVNASEHLGVFIDDPDKVRSEDDYDDAEGMFREAKMYAKMMANPVPFVPVLLDGISTDKDEYRLTISPDNEIALFTRKLEAPGKVRAYDKVISYKERFMYSEKGPEGFGPGEQLPWPFNQTDHESGTLTADNNSLYLMVCHYLKEHNNYYNCDLCVSHRDGEYWGNLENLGPGVNIDTTWEAQPSISADGKILFFTSDRPGGFGGFDIWKTELREDGTWGPAVNLGPSVNTEGNEMSPFLHADNHTLYFASSDWTDEVGNVYHGHPGMGGYDIFFTRIGDNPWKKPRNIGYPINSFDDEIAFFVSTDGKLAYFASNKYDGRGGWDIYYFELYDEARPEKVLLVKGYLLDEYKEPLYDARVELKNMETKAVTEIKVDNQTGKYVAVLPFRNDYLLTVKKQDYTWESKYISTIDRRFDEPVTVELTPRKIAIGESYRLNDIYFATNSDELTPQSLPVIDAFIEFLQANPAIKVSIQGHTDNVGTEADNLDLSQRRALRVYDYIIDNGIPASRLSHVGFGEGRPVAGNDTEDGRALNRRTEFVIIDM